MAVDISIKGIPDALAEALRRRAAEHNRSVEEEVVGILEASVAERPTLTFAELVAEARAQGVGTPAEAVALVREDRDAGHRD
jgi:plasmid stability protein